MRTVPKVGALALTLALAAALVACGSPPATGESPGATGDASPGTGDPATAEEVFAAIAEMGLSYEERIDYLYEKAQEEGTVLLYGTQNELLAQILERFEEDFPGIAVGHISLGSTNLYERISAEARAGRHLVDVITGDSILHAALYNDGNLAEHHGVPVPEGVDEVHVSPWTVTAAMLPHVIVWNTDALSEDEVARTWDDFLTPEHTGCVLDVGGETFAASLIAERGFEAAAQWYEDLIANGAVVRESNTAMTNAIAGGEFDCAVYLYVNRPEDFIQNRDAPLEWRAAENVPVNMSGPSIYAHTERPHAAALLMHYILDVPGGEIWASDGRIPVHPDVQMPSPFERLSVFQPGGELYDLLLPLTGTTALDVAEEAQDLLNTYLVPNYAGD